MDAIKIDKCTYISAAVIQLLTQEHGVTSVYYKKRLSNRYNSGYRGEHSKQVNTADDEDTTTT